MAAIILIIHLLLALGIVGFVLLQRSEGGALGIGGGGGGGGGMGGLVGGRAAANFLTRGTAILAGMFFVTSIVLAILSGAGTDRTRSIIGDVPVGGDGMGQHSAPVEAPAPEQPSGPAVPVGE